MLNIITKNVKYRLQKRVKGTVLCHHIGDTLICDIICDEDMFRYTEKYTSVELAYGLSSITISEQILCAYSDHIKCKFFK